jgi:hypothetical protein
VKAALSEKELCSDAVRLPLTRATLARRQRLRAELGEPRPLDRIAAGPGLAVG